ncbi:MAG: hypothetical protein COS14_09335 [Bacteroidetes bacterium CG02_land_8_20_14_3_00_31_25]|nr:hypothetical protein [Bacteroidota bacterium]PIV58491.1 MAG: hypothetical protein COS14_09335 [Bacteroidetes bacterium CG02_land_8_20_14_3_00_31_25]PIY07332.1 MAG: hypothetical protein COZ21_00820 [Bacteroidetes bacterium CG_4_10_14_3_um_filter_31_20]
METLIVQVDSLSNAKQFLNFIKNLVYIKSVKIEKCKKPLDASDWINPGRPSTDAELEQLALDAEQGEVIPAEISKAGNLKKFAKWKAENSL